MEYVFAETVDRALELLSAPNAKLIAGGTDLSVQIAEKVHSPETLIDLSRISSLQGFARRDDVLVIGAMVTIASLASCPETPACLLQGAASIGSPQIRSLATIGGNICNASPCGDTLAPLIVLRARLRIVSASGQREIPAEDFFLGPKQTVLSEKEVLTEILIDNDSLGGVSAFRMIGQREAQVISQVNLALWMDLTAVGEIRDLRAAVGSVAPVPLRLTHLEQLLIGRRLDRLDAELIDQAKQDIDTEIEPISDVRATEDYRRLVAGGLFEDALEGLSGQGGEA
jgi:carbon-monoxide dehydrogenase medium subunit